MKTIEQKARAYDEALDRAKVYWRTDYDNTLDIKARGTMEHLFPELAESEGERIRKEILEVAKTVVSRDGTLYGKKYNCKEWIAWLEKQGEQKVPVVDFKAEDWYVNKVDGKIHNAKFMEKTPTNQASEKQGEQKPADTCDSLIIKSKEFPASEKQDFGYFNESAEKVEPKFKIGDWIAYNHNPNLPPRKIIQITNEHYVFNNGSFEIKTLEADWHLWTIQDAKDGDLLADDYGIYIFDRFDEYDEKCFLCTGAYQYSQKVFKNEHMLCSVEVHPATKEQHDLLFQKMHEAGYTFDFKKKEVKKLKFKVGDEIITEHEESLTITRIDEEGYWSNDLFICGFDDSDEWELVEQNPYGQKKECLDCQFNYAGECKGSCAMKRNEQESTWSKEDKERYISCLQRLGTGNPEQPETINSKWFKDHVYPQNTWKPSDEQMKVLDEVLNFAANHESPYWNDYIFGTLNNLIRQLKKLKGG